MNDREKNCLFLSEGSSEISLHAPRGYADGHGFSQVVDVRADGIQGSVIAVSYANVATWVKFRDALLGLYESLSGKVDLGPVFDKLRLSLTGDGMGHFAVDVEIRDGDILDTRLSFRFSVDQTQLPAVIRAITGFIEAGSTLHN